MAGLLAVIEKAWNTAVKAARWKWKVFTTKRKLKKKASSMGKYSQLGGGAKNQGKPHLPMVTLSPGRAPGQVAVEITAVASAPDAIDYIWATDAATGEIFEGRKFVPKETPSLVFIVPRGRRFVPSAHGTSDGVWEGEAVVAEA